MSALRRPRSPLDPSPLMMVLSYIVLVFWAFVALFPIYWTVTTSFKVAVEAWMDVTRCLVDSEKLVGVDRSGCCD